jgi:hypothetical protein
MVCFRYIIVNTMHNGDKKDDDDNNNNNLNARMFECGMDSCGSKLGQLVCPCGVH